MAKNNKIIKMPFGKYKDQEIANVLSDNQYVEWLLTQSWIKERYPPIFQIIQQYNFEDQPTPEHNAMQAQWLDKKYREKFYSFILNHFRDKVQLYNNDSNIYWTDEIEFEYSSKNIDIFVILTGKIFFQKINLYKENSICNERIWFQRSFPKKEWEMGKQYFTINQKCDSETIEKYDLNNFEKKYKNNFRYLICPVHGIYNCCNCSNNDNWKNGHDKNCYNENKNNIYDKIFIKKSQFPEKFNGNRIDIGIEAEDKFKFTMELKPIIGDDYPSILRKMKKNNIDYLICQKFTSEAVNIEKVKKIFELSHKQFILESEFWEETN